MPSGYSVSEPSLQDAHAEHDEGSSFEPSIAELRVDANGGQDNVHLKEVHRHDEQDPIYQAVKKSSRDSWLITANCQRSAVGSGVLGNTSLWTMTWLCTVATY